MMDVLFILVRFHRVSNYICTYVRTYIHMFHCTMYIHTYVCAFKIHPIFFIIVFNTISVLIRMLPVCNSYWCLSPTFQRCAVNIRIPKGLPAICLRRQYFKRMYGWSELNGSGHHKRTSIAAEKEVSGSHAEGTSHFHHRQCTDRPN